LGAGAGAGWRGCLRAEARAAQVALCLADADRLGFIYDSGHAQALDCLGFYPYEDWLKRFSNRIIGSHLHDAIGIQDHLAPGLGEIDFNMVAAYLPDNAFRTMEVQSHNSNEQVKNGIRKLVEAGCVHPLKGVSHAHIV
jgi:sugar phosphate isomerase/epimerase